MENKLIVKIYQVKSGQLLINIPKKFVGLKAGDYVTVKKLELFDIEGNLSIGVETEPKEHIKTDKIWK